MNEQISHLQAMGTYHGQYDYFSIKHLIDESKAEIMDLTTGIVKSGQNALAMSWDTGEILIGQFNFDKWMWVSPVSPWKAGDNMYTYCDLAMNVSNTDKPKYLAGRLVLANDMKDMIYLGDPYDETGKINGRHSDAEGIIDKFLDSPEDPSFSKIPIQIYDKRSDAEMAGITIQDITTVQSWYSIDISGLKFLREHLQLESTQHGLDILTKLMKIPGLIISRRRMVAIILHDILKFKDRDEIVNTVMSSYFGRPFESVGNHGLDSGLLLLELFPDMTPGEIAFVFRHAKRKPYKCDDSKFTDLERAFFIFDELKDLAHFKFVLQKNDWDILNQYYQKPNINTSKTVFDILKKSYKDKEKIKKPETNKN